MQYIKLPDSNDVMLTPDQAETYDHVVIASAGRNGRGQDEWKAMAWALQPDTDGISKAYAARLRNTYKRKARVVKVKTGSPDWANDLA